LSTDPLINWTAATFPQIDGEMEKIGSSQDIESAKQNDSLSSLTTISSGKGWLLAANKRSFLVLM
jgi:hypothetical protein